MSVQSCLVLVIAGTAVLMDFLMEKVINSFICLGLLAGFVRRIKVLICRLFCIFLFFICIGSAFAFVLFSYAGGGRY